MPRLIPLFVLVCALGCDDESEPMTAADATAPDATLADAGLDRGSMDMAPPLADQGAALDMAADMAPAIDMAADMTPTIDMAADMSLTIDMAPAIDMAADMTPAIDMALDMAPAVDMAPDMAPDMAVPAPVACATDDDCAPNACVLGRCAAFSEVQEDAEGLAGADNVIAACDADGTIRLLTQHEGDQRLGYYAAGRPGAWDIGPGLAMAARNSTQLTNGTRQGTARAHQSFLVNAYRNINVDGRGTVSEDRVITRHHHAFDANGALWLLTVPRVPGGIDDLHPLILWRPDGDGWLREQVQRDVGFGQHHHLRFDAAGAPEILRLTGGVGGLVRRYAIGVEGWGTENIWRENLGGNPGASAAINGPDGATHVLLTSREGDGIAVTYLRVVDAGVDRQIAVFAADNHALVTQSLQFDDAGNLYFLTYGPVSRQDQRPVVLHRIAPDDAVTRSAVDFIDVDVFGSDLKALAMEPDGDFHLIDAPRDGRMRIRSWETVLR